VVVNRDRIVSAVLMMQREVAARLTSSPGQKDWSPLAIFCQVHFDVDRAFDVPPDSFDPPPEVTSSVVKLTRRESIPLSHPRAFESLVRASFRQRRKQLVNNLVPQLTQDSTALRAELEQLGLPASVRAEEISLARFADLTRALVERGLLADA